MSETANLTRRMGEKRLRDLDATDNMPPEMRALVHEFGSSIVNTFVSSGITKPNMIRMFVHTCWVGAREPQQRHGLHTKKSPVADALDWLLEQQGAQITAATLLRVLAMHGMTIVPTDPSGVMINASMATVSGHDEKMTKYEKHRRRVKAAIEASCRRLFPQVYGDENV